MLLCGCGCCSVAVRRAERKLVSLHATFLETDVDTDRQIISIVSFKNSAQIKRNNLKLLKGTKFFNGYDPRINAQMSASFSVAAFRFGHSLVQEEFMRFTQDGFQHHCNKAEFSPIPVLDFGNPTYLYDKCNGGVDSIFRGLLKSPAAKMDG